MAKGDMIKNDFKEFKDPYTGRRVIRLTAPDHLSHHPYFYNKMITDDNRYLIYAAQKGQTRNLYKMDLTDGTAVQLTEGGDIEDFGCRLTSDDAYLIFCRGQQIVRMNMDDLDEKVIYETPAGRIGYGNPGMSSDDRYLVTVEMDAADKVESKGDWSAFEPQWAKKPRCRIVYIDAQTKMSHIIYEERCWLGHPQIRPFDNNTILFCHEGPWYRIDARLWLINADGSNLRCAKPQQMNELVTHEYWLSDGSRFAFVDKKPEDAKRTIRFIDPDTLQEEVLMECSDYCHCISNKDNTFITGDGQQLDEHFIYLIDVKRRQEYKLCSHGTSWKSYGNNQDAHPHPAFWPDGRSIIFTSDMDGLPCIYRVDLEQ